MSHDGRADVVIVGSGIMGSLVARAIAERRPSADILLVEVGPDLTPERSGSNLKDIRDLPRRESLQVRSQGPDQFSYGVDAMSDRARTVVRSESMADLVRAGTFLVSRAGHESADMPALSMSSNVGGMGAHWTCACPAPGGSEISPDVPADEWDAAWAEASRYLTVTTGCFPPSALTDWILSTLDEAVPAHHRRRAQLMPMSWHDGRWGSPSEVLGEGRRRLRAETLCTGVIIEGGGVRGVELTDLRDGTRSRVHAPHVVVAGDSLRTPQLLYASGVRPWALGRFLNEHARILSSVLLTGSAADGLSAATELVDPTDPMQGSFWIPFEEPGRPFHTQVSLLDLNMIKGQISPTGAGKTVALSTLVPTEVSAENRLEFSEERTDAYGMPAFRVRFGRSAADEALIADAVADQRALQRLLNPSADPAPPTLMPVGSSLHYSGTVRAGARDDGASVCDTRGRVWGVEGLYVASNGVAPAPLAHNVTPSGAGFAVRTGATVAGALE